MLNYARNTLKKNPTWDGPPPSEQASDATATGAGAKGTTTEPDAKDSTTEVGARREKLEVQVKHMDNLTEEQVDAVTSVLVKAFAGDPFGAILVGGDTSLSPVQLRATVETANIGGTIHVATLPPKEGGEEDQIIGVAVWFSPGQSQNSTAEQRAGWDIFMEALNEETRKWWSDYFIPFMSHSTTAAYGDGVVLQAWDLHLFGVLPEYQGRGAAGALMRYTDGLAKETGAPMVLATQKQENVTIYKRLGFEVKGEVVIESGVGNSNFWMLAKGLYVGNSPAALSGTQ